MSLERLGVGTYKTTCAADTEYFGELLDDDRGVAADAKF